MQINFGKINVKMEEKKLVRAFIIKKESFQNVKFVIKIRSSRTKRRFKS